LRRQSQDERVYAYREVRAGLFDDIASRKLPPGEGPRSSDPSAQVSPHGRQ
jgi:hypothetical protein